MVLAVPLRILLICLLHFCTCAVGEDVDRKTLMNIVENFENQLRDMGQYAIVFRVEKDKCRPGSDYLGPDLTEVKKKFQKNEVYKNNDLIAARADKNKQDHSEYRLKNYLKDVLNVKNKCVVYFTVNSPCLDKCISNVGEFSIKGNLQMLEKYGGIKAFAFKKIWRDDEDKRDAVIKKLKEIAPDLPYYQCETNKCDRLKKKN